jgi:osmotically inducible lipoprotein OsmB
MSTIKTLTASTLAAVALVGLSGCADMSRRDRDMAIGAGVGAVAGSALTGGSALGTVGGAAVGGVVGSEVGKNKR